MVWMGQTVQSPWHSGLWNKQGYAETVYRHAFASVTNLCEGSRCFISGMTSVISYWFRKLQIFISRWWTFWRGWQQDHNSNSGLIFTLQWLGLQWSDISCVFYKVRRTQVTLNLIHIGSTADPQILWPNEVSGTVVYIEYWNVLWDAWCPIAPLW